MAEPVDPHAILLQVLAHDILAPLTALKWQMELLSKPDLDEKKRTIYYRELTQSTALGISLAKQAHLASSVLSGTYQGTRTSVALHTVLAEGLRILKPQYERHALSLDVALADDDCVRSLDKELALFYVWVLGKFLLTVCPANTAVRAEGAPTRTRAGIPVYAFHLRAAPVEGATSLAERFTSPEPIEARDQTYVFAHLKELTTPLVALEAEAHANDATLTLTTYFGA